MHHASGCVAQTPPRPAAAAARQYSAAGQAGRLAAHLHVSCVGPHFCQGGIDFRPELPLTRLNRGVAGRHSRRHLGQTCNRKSAAAVQSQLGINQYCGVPGPWLAAHSLQHSWFLGTPYVVAQGHETRNLVFGGFQKAQAPKPATIRALCNPPLFVASARAACADAAAAAKRARPPSSAAMRSAAAASLERLADSRADRLASTACLRQR